MTISTTSNQITLAGNGATTVFSFNFVGDSPSDVEVIYTNANGAQTTIAASQYLVAINPSVPGQLWGLGGTVTYPLVGSPIAAGTTLTIQRILSLTQEVDISNQGDFYPTVTERALDVLCMEIQQLAARTGQIRGTWISGVQYNYSDIVVDGPAGANTGNLYSCAISNLSGTWATDLSNGDWSLALNVQSIVNSLPQISNNQVFGNISGGTATPTGVNVSALLDSAIGSIQGSVLYRSGSAWTVLTPGTSGQVLTTQGASANPQWSSTSGTGSVTSVATGAGLTGGPITTTGTVSLATVADKAMLANTSGGTAVPGATTLSAYLDNVLGSTQGSIIYRGGATWASLGPGSSGQLLQSQGAGLNPHWVSSSGVGTVTAGTALILNPYNTSTTSNGLHGLGSVPSFYITNLICTSPDLNYSVGDVIQMYGAPANGSGDTSFTVSGDATRVYLSTAQTIRITNKTGAGGNANIAVGNWQLVITPYKIN